MARDRQKTIINGYRYEMTMLGATASYRLFHRLLKMFGPSVGAFMEATSGGLDSVDISSDVVVRGIRTLTSSISEEDFDYLVAQMREETFVSVDNVHLEKTIPLRTCFELHFSGEIGSLFQWLYWSLKVQYGTFTDAFANFKSLSGGEDTQAASSPSP